MFKRVAVVAVVAVCLMFFVGCSNGSATSSKSSTAISSSSSASQSTSKSSTSELRTLLTKCAQDFFDTGDPLTGATLTNNTERVESLKNTIDSDLSQLNALTEIPKEQQEGVEVMKNCLSKYSEAIGLYAEGSKYVNKDDAKADTYFDQADPLAAEAHNEYEHFFSVIGNFVVRPTKRSSSKGTATNTTTPNTSTGTGATASTGTGTTKSGVDATKKYKQGDRTGRLTGTVTKKASDTYWVDGDDGIEYKCWPDDKNDLQYFAPGMKIEFSGTVRSTSQMSCNLEKALWLGNK